MHDDPADDSGRPPVWTTPPVREVPADALADGTAPVYCRGSGWLLWRHDDVFGVRAEGPLWRELLPRLEHAAAHLASTERARIDLLIDASSLEVGAGAHHLQAAADAIAAIVQHMAARLHRLALVAPSDWSTPWWHGLPMLVQSTVSWRTYAAWTDAYDWLDGAPWMRAELERLFTSGPDTLMTKLDLAMRRAPADDLATIARLLGLSRRTIQRALARAGVGFRELRTRIRIERAEALLLSPHAKVSAVAREVGFASTGHFILWFRRHRGATPGSWRSRLQGDAAAPGIANDPRSS